jgi:hypothetical protein
MEYSELFSGVTFVQQQGQQQHEDIGTVFAEMATEERKLSDQIFGFLYQNIGPTAMSEVEDEYDGENLMGNCGVGFESDEDGAVSSEVSSVEDDGRLEEEEEKERKVGRKFPICHKI